MKTDILGVELSYKLYIPVRNLLHEELHMSSCLYFLKQWSTTLHFITILESSLNGNYFSFSSGENNEN